MINIHKNCFETADEFVSSGNYVIGANITGFLKLARALDAMGLI